MLFDLNIEIRRIVKMVADGEKSVKIDNEILRLAEKQKIINQRSSSHAVLLLIDDLYGSDIKSLKSDFTKYMFFKDRVQSNIRCTTNLSFLLKISRTLDRLTNEDYSIITKEIEAREAEALLSESELS